MDNYEITVEDVLNNSQKDLSSIFEVSKDKDSYNEIVQSNYYSESEFLNYLTTEKISDTTHLKILSLNIANLLSKLNSLKVFLTNISNHSNKPNIIVVTETHLDRNINHGYSASELQHLLPNYLFFHEDRKNKKGGGVGIFIEDELVNHVTILQ